jgi:ABC-type nitrate/sulfonate/bicarbonate transport system substrate-binding protein
MAVTRPQTRPGLVDEFTADLDDAVRYAHEHRDETPKSAAIYGGIPGGPTPEADEFIRTVMTEMMDHQQGLPAAPGGL